MLQQRGKDMCVPDRGYGGLCRGGLVFAQGKKPVCHLIGQRRVGGVINLDPVQYLPAAGCQFGFDLGRITCQHDLRNLLLARHDGGFDHARVSAFAERDFLI